MTIIVKGSPLAAPLLETDRANTVLVYDNQDKLMYFLLVLPSEQGTSSFITSDIKDNDFFNIATNLGLKLYK